MCILTAPSFIICECDYGFINCQALQADLEPPSKVPGTNPPKLYAAALKKGARLFEPLRQRVLQVRGAGLSIHVCVCVHYRNYWVRETVILTLSLSNLAHHAHRLARASFCGARSRVSLTFHASSIQTC